MARYSSQPSPVSNTAPSGSATSKVAGMRRRRPLGSSSSQGGESGSAGNMLRFYSTDAPGMKISPTTVLVMSLVFIVFVTGLHVFGKVYLQQS